MAIINKWHCLVEQVKNEHKRGTGAMKSSSASSIHKQRHFTHGAIELASSGDVSEKSTQKSHHHHHHHHNQNQGSENDLNETADDHSQATDDDSRHGRTTQR